MFNHPAAISRLCVNNDVTRLGEDYLAGLIDIEGDVEAAFGLIPYIETLEFQTSRKLRLLRDAWLLKQHAPTAAPSRVGTKKWRQRARNSGDSIAHHYDVGNAFYRLWLDPEMVYSCAYFASADQPLDAAQRDKLDYICRKLRLQPGQKLLDIGCGWGALVRWAARHYGVTAHGITLSEEQYRYARDRVRAEGLEHRVRIELLDYRNLPEDAQYDRVTSVGMFEHLGVKELPHYFATIHRVLAPGGLFLNHGITHFSGWNATPITRFVNRHVFPDGELARVSDVCSGMEAAGFELFDVESLRRHYVLTLRKWIRALEAHRSAVVAASSEATFRLWRLYMAGSAHFFGEGSTNVYQILAGKRGEKVILPMRRDDLYI
ncbi:MAG: cyclopropane-fatty-acyl-phospholipid synthase family protein [Pseudomonadota bacterium]|nr:cyclopropane-fatty-acyl-phospholipid synthase family protein [Pseudomonadota bacterium]